MYSFDRSGVRKEIIPMENYSYVVIDKDGREKKGSMEGHSAETVMNSLKAEGLIPLEVSEQSLLNKEINLSFGNKISARDYSLFCRQFVGIITAGVSIIDALEMVSEQTENKHLAEAIRNTQVSVQKGETLANAMKEQGKVFPSILINMVEAGEASGSLEVAFDRMATQFEKDARIKAMVKKAMIYPCVVGCVAFAVIIVMLVVVIPNFESLFSQIGTELPAITVMVKNMSTFIIDYWYVLVILIGGILIGFQFYKNTESGSRQLSKWALSVPVFGKLNQKSFSSRYARTMSTLLAAGIPLIEAIEITAKTLDNKVLQETLLSARDEVARGVALSTSLKASGAFPTMVCHMTKIGEETGNIEDMLNRLADYYDEEVEMATQSLSAALEPMIIIVLAVIVCFLIAAIMTPMIKMYQGMDNIV